MSVKSRLPPKACKDGVLEDDDNDDLVVVLDATNAATGTTTVEHNKKKKMKKQGNDGILLAPWIGRVMEAEAVCMYLENNDWMGLALLALANKEKYYRSD